MQRLLMSVFLALAALPTAAQSVSGWSYRATLTADLWDRLLILSLASTNGDPLALIRCPYAQGRTVIDMTLAASVGDTHNGAAAELILAAPGLSRRLAGWVMREPGWVEGVVVSLDAADPLWDALAAAQTLEYARPDHPSATLPLDGFADLARRFVDDCRSIADLPALPAPSQPGASPTKRWRDPLRQG